MMCHVECTLSMEPSRFRKIKASGVALTPAVVTFKMIKMKLRPEDIRVDNTVNNEHGEAITVEAKHILSLEKGISDFYGIPITEDCILKIGGKKHWDDRGYLLKGYIYIDLKYDNCYIHIKGSYLTCLHYLHELQNLILDLKT